MPLPFHYFSQIVLTDELRQLPIKKFGRPWEAERIGAYEQLNDVQHCQDTLYIDIAAVTTSRPYLLAYQKDNPVPISKIRVFGEVEGEDELKRPCLSFHPKGSQELTLKNAFTYPQPAGEEDLVRTPPCIDRDVLTSCKTEPNTQFPFLAVELESEALVNTVTVYLDHSWPPCSGFGCNQKMKVA